MLLLLSLLLVVLLLLSLLSLLLLLRLLHKKARSSVWGISFDVKRTKNLLLLLLLLLLLVLLLLLLLFLLLLLLCWCLCLTFRGLESPVGDSEETLGVSKDNTGRVSWLLLQQLRCISTDIKLVGQRRGPAERADPLFYPPPSSAQLRSCRRLPEEGRQRGHPLGAPFRGAPAFEQSG